MPGRSGSSEAYRYGFNGMEKDDEGEFGSQTNLDFGARIYNPAIARFLSVDPLTDKFPWFTPYQYAGNKPIAAIDLDGLENVIIHSRTVGKEFKAALDNGDVYDGFSAMTWLSRNNHKGKYPNGVLKKPWANTGDHKWLKDERGKGFSIPNEIAQFTYSTTSESSSVMWMEDFVDVDGNIGVMYNVKVFLVDEDGERYTEDAKFTYTIDGGYFVYGDGAGAGLDLSAGTVPGGSYGSIDWGSSNPGGGGIGFQSGSKGLSAIINGFVWAKGLFFRGKNVESNLKTDPGAEMGEDKIVPQEPPSKLISITIEEIRGEVIDQLPNGTTSTSSKTKATFGFDRGKRDSTGTVPWTVTKSKDGNSSSSIPVTKQKNVDVNVNY